MNAQPPETPPQRPPRPPFPWLHFLVLLLAPAVLTCISVLVDRSSTGPAPAVGFIGGALGGIASGIFLGVWVGRTVAARVVWSFVFAVVCGVVSITLAMFGCLASGYSLNLH